MDEHGFLGATEDPSGLTHLGAREYDPLLGRFISADPVMDPLDSQQMGGYAYASHSPVTFADPSGLYETEYAGDNDRSCNSCTSAAEEYEVDNQERKRALDEGDVEEARDIQNTSWVDVVIDAGAEILLDLLGVNDIIDCVGSGDLWACGSLLLDLIPWAKVAKIIGKLAKSAKKIINTVTGFIEKTKWAKNLLGKVDDAMAEAASRANERIAALRQSRAPSRCLTGNSFTAGTEVVMADGSTKPIEDVQTGEEVLATDETTGETSSREVVMLIEGTGDRTLVEIAVDTDGEPDATVTATDGHPIWTADPATVPTEVAFGGDAAELEMTPVSPAESADGSGSGGGGPPHVIEEPLPGQWADAIDLKIGQLLRTSAGTWIQVQAVEVRSEQATVYNLTVADLHTYSVAVGSTDFLTHNVGECPVSGASHGDMGESATGQRLQDEGYTSITSEVPFEASDGTRFRADFVAQNPAGNWVAVEVKTGSGASLTNNQMIGYSEISDIGAILRSSRVPGLNKGDRVRMEMEIDLWECPLCSD